MSTSEVERKVRDLQNSICSLLLGVGHLEADLGHPRPSPQSIAALKKMISDMGFQINELADLISELSKQKKTGPS